MAKYPSLKSINDNHEKWRKATESSRRRIDDFATFLYKQEMWGSDVKCQRKENNAISHQYNFLRKYPAAMLGQSKNIDLSLSMQPLSAQENTDGDDEEIAAKKIIESMLINQNSRNIFYDGLAAMLKNGQAVFFVSETYEDSNSCNKIPTITKLSESTEYSFDLNAKLKSFNDGEYMTLKIPVSSKLIRENYGSKFSDYTHKDSNIITEHFYKLPKKIKCFFHKETRQYVAGNKIKDSEWGDYDTERTKFRIFKKVHVVKYLNDFDEPLVKGLPYFTEDLLPGVYCYALTERIRSISEDNSSSCPYTVEQFPFGWELKDAQELHNFVGSQMATQAKQSIGRLFLIGSSNLKDEKSAKNLEDIHKRYGPLQVDNVEDVKVVDAPQITATLLQTFTLLREEMDALAAVFVDTDAKQAKDMPGVTLRQIVNQNNIVSNPIFEAHIDVINQVGKVVLAALPNIVVEERVYNLGDSNDANRIVKVNEYVNGSIHNDINDICNKFKFKIEASPSDEIDKANTITIITDLMKIIQSDPSLQGKSSILLDMIPKLISSNYSGELLKRISLVQDQNFIKYINGELTLDEYNKIIAQQKAEAQANQQAMQQQAMQFKEQELQIQKEKADTDRFSAMSDASTKKMDSQTKRFESEMNVNLEHQKQSVNQYEQVSKNYREEMASKAEIVKASHEDN